MSDSSYLFDNASLEAATRFSGLEAALDATTFRHLRDCGVGRGWVCLEIGAGSGSVVRWLAEEVGPSGAVVGTDLNLSWIDDISDATNVELRVHDVVRDEIEIGRYNLVHARLVLLHLPARDAVIEKLISALAPGGWLVLEEFTHVLPYGIPEPETEAELHLNRILVGVRELLGVSGADTQGYPRSLVRRLHGRGLIDVCGEGTVVFGQSGVADVLRANVRQVSDQLIGTGHISAEDLAEALRTLDRSEHLLALPMLVSAWGRKV